jgi:hypothetical protein
MRPFSLTPMAAALAMAAARWAALTVGSREARALASFISCAWLRSILRGAAIVAAYHARQSPSLQSFQDPVSG